VAKLIGLIVSGIGLVVWSESPVTRAEESALVTRTAQPIPGSYELLFLDPLTHQEVTMQSFGEAVTLHAQIDDASGIAADGGRVVFQYCSLKGRPSNDITRVDEVPFEKCESGEANWANLAGVPVNALGNAELVFCCPMITPTIGFRYTYMGQGSGIDNFTILPKNFNWGP